MAGVKLRRLTEPQWEALARAVALAEAEWDIDEAMTEWRTLSATLNRAWDRLCDARQARVI